MNSQVHHFFFRLSAYLLIFNCLMFQASVWPFPTVAPQVDTSIAVYAQREQTVPAIIKAKLDSLRKIIFSKRLSFTVGYTKALDYPLGILTGLRKPPDLRNLIKSRNKIARSVQRSLGAVPRARYSVSQSHFDWREHGGSTAVRDQGYCGSCWDFGTVAAYEGAYEYANGSALDLSEQDILNCSGFGTCAGGWVAFDYLVDHGIATEADYPYTASDDSCRSNVSRPYRATNWGYVIDQEGTPGKLQMKTALINYGPLWACVYASTAFMSYTGGMFDEGATNEINHVVTIIGWDDGMGAWLIKNSWGKTWGNACGSGTERGYMWIKYGSNSIGYAAAWVTPTISLVNKKK